MRNDQQMFDLAEVFPTNELVYQQQTEFVWCNTFDKVKYSRDNAVGLQVQNTTFQFLSQNMKIVKIRPWKT